MKKYYMGYSECCDYINRLSEKFGVPFDTWDCREGCLQDNFIGSFVKEGYNPFTIMAIEHYSNCWSSDLEVTVARTKGDNEKIDKRWYEFTEAYDAEFPEEEEV